MENEIKNILSGYGVSDRDGLTRDLKEYMTQQLEDAYTSLKDDINNSLWDLKHGDC